MVLNQLNVPNIGAVCTLGKNLVLSSERRTFASLRLKHAKREHPRYQIYVESALYQRARQVRCDAAYLLWGVTMVYHVEETEI